MTSIGNYAFSANPNLASVTLDPNATGLNFDSSSFPGDLWTAYNGANKGKAGTWVKGGTPPAWAFALPAECFTVNADGAIDEFLDTKTGCDLEEFAIPTKKGATTITAIGNSAFQNKSLTFVTIPNRVETIGDNAFFNNDITSLSIGNSVTTIGSHAFSANQLESLSIPDSVETIGEYAFYGNILTSLSMGNRVALIGEYAFFNNANLKTIIFDPNPGLSFVASSFPGDLWAAYDAQDPKQAGTWTYNGSTWRFSR